MILSLFALKVTIWRNREKSLMKSAKGILCLLAVLFLVTTPAFGDAADELCNRGFAKATKGDLDDAIADFNKAIELKPVFGSCYIFRGMAKRGKNDLDGALADFTKAIEIKPSSAEAYANRAYVRQMKGDWDDWPAKISGFLTGQLTEPDFFKAAENADKKKDREQHCEAYFYAGSKRLIENDKITATNYFKKSLATDVKTFSEYQSAAAELKLHHLNLQGVSNASPGNSAFMLCDCCNAFHRQYQRWPKDYAELSGFVQKSDGKLKLGHYDQVKFTSLPDGTLEIWQVSGGATSVGTLKASPTKK